MEDKIETIKKIRELLLRDSPRWRTIQAMCKDAKLDDTAFREMLLNKNVKGLLDDYLLDVNCWKKQLKHKGKKLLCPFCKEDLIGNGMAGIQQGNMYYRVDIEDGKMTFEEDEFEEESGDFEICCRSCGGTIDRKYFEKKGITM